MSVSPISPKILVSDVNVSIGFLVNTTIVFISSRLIWASLRVAKNLYKFSPASAQITIWFLRLDRSVLMRGLIESGGLIKR